MSGRHGHSIIKLLRQYRIIRRKSGIQHLLQTDNNPSISVPWHLIKNSGIHFMLRHSNPQCPVIRKGNKMQIQIVSLAPFLNKMNIPFIP